MLSSIHVLPGVDLVTGAFALSVFVAGAAVAVLIVLGVVAFRRAGHAGASGALWRGALVLVGAMLAWSLLDRSSLRDEFGAERRAIETRTAELTARAIARGSPLACLDAVAGAAVEGACEKALFATPEAVAAALAYVDARLSLLMASVRLAERDPSYRPSLERLRRAFEADRFGLVAHVLMTRGCNAADCPELKLVRERGRILANMKARSFDAHVGAHAVAWQPGSGAVASAAPAAPAQPSLAPMPSQHMPAATTGVAPSAPGANRFDYPSAASIPPVSIMNAEPETPPPSEPAAAQPAEPRSAAPKHSRSQATRRQSARETSPSPPLSVVPPAGIPQRPQITGTR